MKKCGNSIVRSISDGRKTPKNKLRQLKHNWRPITLFDSVYKIPSGVIASRLKRFLNKFIYGD